jgi:hypothetical protein
MSATTSPPGITSSFTEAQGFQAVGNFLQSICSPTPIEVIRQIGNTAPGVNNRVPEPINGDFIVMSSLRQPRLATNLETYADNVFVGSVAANALTVTSITRGSVPLGAILLDGTYPPILLPNTTILSQLMGTAGGIGVYMLSNSQTLSSQTLYAGVASRVAAAQWTVQVDIHGPNSMNNARVVETLTRSEYAVDFFAGQNPAIVPMYAGDPHQAPWQNEEQQIELRWVLDLEFQINVIIGTPQQFADQVKVTTVEADAITG